MTVVSLDSEESKVLECMVLRTELSFANYFPPSNKCSVCEAFGSTALSIAHNILWKNCLVELKEANLDYHPRRGSDKNSHSDLLLGDILVAFDYLDASNKLPLIYCEANDLIRLPPLAPDLVSEKLEHNTTALLTLSSKVDTLPSTLANSLSLPPVSQPQCSNLEKLVVELSEHLKAFSRNVGAISSQITTSASSQNIQHSPPQASTDSAPSY